MAPGVDANLDHGSRDRGVDQQHPRDFNRSCYLRNGPMGMVLYVAIQRGYSYEAFKHRPRVTTPLPLILERNDHLDAGDRFRVVSGKAVVGMLMRVPSGEKAGWWHWSITSIFVSPEDFGPSAGMSPSRQEAMADFAKRWRLWLEWAGLREEQPEERVRLP